MKRPLLLGLLIAGIMSTCALSAPIQYRCSFPKVFNLDHGLTAQNFDLTLVYDKATDTAAIIGSAGVSSLQVNAGFAAVSFVELVPSGVVQTLTMLPSGKAVYSRHTTFFPADEFSASQQYGSCVPTK